MRRLALLALGVALLPIACDGCRGCPVDAVTRPLPEPLGEAPRPHEGPTTRRWSGPCWRDFAGPRGVGASTALTYDADGFITRLHHMARRRGGYTERVRTFTRGPDGATVEERRADDERDPVAIRYRVSEPSAQQPVLVEPHDDPQLCVCPADDRTVCWIGPRVFCLSLQGTLFPRPDPRMTSCITCGTQIEVEQQRPNRPARTKTYRRTDDGIDMQEGERRTQYRVDVPADLVREITSTTREHRIPHATLQDVCAIPSRHCTFDDHGNLLEFTALAEDGTVKQTDVLNYTCREQN